MKFRKQPRRLSVLIVVILLLWVVKNIFLAGISWPFYGEDEPSHFGYVEAIGRLDEWFVFSNNLASIEMRLLDHWWEHAHDRERVLREMNGERFMALRAYASPHQNATAYQPPLYYYLLSIGYRLWPMWPMITLLYLLRIFNILVGLGLVFTIWKIAEQLDLKDTEKIIMVTLVAFLPLLSLTAATVTVQVFVMWLYSMFIYWLLRTDRRVKSLVFALVIMWLGLLSQQAFLAAPFIWLVVLGWELQQKKVTGRQALVLVLLLCGIVASVVPQYLRRHSITRYVASDVIEPVRQLTPVTYLVSQADRIQDELLNHFWDQRISMTPYRVSSRAGRSARWLVVFAFVGMMVAVKSWWKQRPLWILLGLTMGGMFVVGHFWYDWFQLRYNGQEYLKSRYFYPLLPFIGFGMAQGISIIKDKVWQATVVLFLVSIFIWLNYSALGWLLIYIE